MRIIPLPLKPGKSCRHNCRNRKQMTNRSYVYRNGWWPVVAIAGLVLGALAGSTQGASPDSARRANVLILYADDLGYADVSCYNPDPDKKIIPPNIDRLATEGMRFTDGHSSCAICTPSRYALLTGRYHWRRTTKVIALRLGKPPKGFANWSLRLLASRVVELGIVDSISRETVRQTLKKTA